MKKYFKTLILFFSMTATTIASANAYNNDNVGNIQGEEVTYAADGVTLKGYIAYDANKKGKRPAILVIPEWWGNNEYPRMRARKLAELGYIAMAVDMYGEGKIAANPDEAKTLASPLYQAPNVAKSRLEAAEMKLKTYDQTDAENMAAIGYCFGGSMALNVAKLGMDFKGVVSFHGGLAGVAPDKNLLKADILVCHGAADKFVSDEDVAAFKKGLDSIGAKYTFKVYPDATHAFTNPSATVNGKKFNMPIAYNEAADKKSWEDMKEFFNKIFK